MGDELSGPWAERDELEPAPVRAHMAQPDRQVVLGQQAHKPLRPLDERDLLRRKEEIQIEPGGRRRTVEPVAIHVDERNLAGILAHQDERRALDGVGVAPESARHALDQGRLAAAQLSLQGHHVARAQEAADPFPERLGLLHRPAQEFNG